MSLFDQLNDGPVSEIDIPAEFDSRDIAGWLWRMPIVLKKDFITGHLLSEVLEVLQNLAPIHYPPKLIEEFIVCLGSKVTEKNSLEDRVAVARFITWLMDSKDFYRRTENFASLETLIIWACENLTLSSSSSVLLGLLSSVTQLSPAYVPMVQEKLTKSARQFLLEVMQRKESRENMTLKLQSIRLISNLATVSTSSQTSQFVSSFMKSEDNRRYARDLVRNELKVNTGGVDGLNAACFYIYSECIRDEHAFLLYEAEATSSESIIALSLRMFSNQSEFDSNKITLVLKLLYHLAKLSKSLSDLIGKQISMIDEDAGEISPRSWAMIRKCPLKHAALPIWAGRLCLHYWSENGTSVADIPDLLPSVQNELGMILNVIGKTGHVNAIFLYQKIFILSEILQLASPVESSTQFENDADPILEILNEIVNLKLEGSFIAKGFCGLAAWLNYPPKELNIHLQKYLRHLVFCKDDKDDALFGVKILRRFKESTIETTDFICIADSAIHGSSARNMSECTPHKLKRSFSEMSTEFEEDKENVSNSSKKSRDSGHKWNSMIEDEYKRQIRGLELLLEQERNSRRGLEEYISNMSNSDRWWQKNIIDLSSDNQALIQQVESSSAKIEEYKTKTAKYQRELKNQRNEAADLRTKLQTAESKVYSLTNEIADNRKNANEAMANLQRLFGGKK